MTLLALKKLVDDAVLESGHGDQERLHRTVYLEVCARATIKVDLDCLTWNGDHWVLT